MNENLALLSIGSLNLFRPYATRWQLLLEEHCDRAQCKVTI